MNGSDFITVFNLADTGYRDWTFPAFGLIFVAIGLFLPKLVKAGVFGSNPRMGPWFPIVFLGFAIFWTATAFLATFSEYLKDRDALISGKAAYVEGTVENFVPMPYTGHALESFSVNGIPFNYADGVVKAGFNNTASHGGPIRQRLYVRIWYLGNDILKLQIPKNEKSLNSNSLPASAQPPLITFPVFFGFWIALGVGSWVLIAWLPTAQAKKSWSDRISILASIIFFAFLWTQFAPTKGSFALFIMGPALALITWLNIRNTYFCDKCSKRSYDRNWFANTYCCPNCGNKLK
jgi:hypothetical protein